MTRNQRAALGRRRIAAMTANIMAIYLDAPKITREAGARWYDEEGARCEDFARRHGIAPVCVAGAAAAISPGMRWDLVFSYLAALVHNPSAKVPTYSREFVKRAVRCLSGENPDVVLSGPKVTAFYRLLSGEPRHRLEVVIDGHAWNICLMERHAFRNSLTTDVPAAARVTAARYRLAVEAYRTAAYDLGVLPHQVQATTWVHWRNMWTPF